MKNWKNSLLNDSVLYCLTEKHFSVDEFVLETLASNNLSEIYNKLTGLKQNFHESFLGIIDSNYLNISDDFKQMSDLKLDFSEIQINKNELNLKSSEIQTLFLQKYEKLQKLIPLLENANSAISITKNSLKFIHNLSVLKSLINEKEILDLRKAGIIYNEIDNMKNLLSDLIFFENERSNIEIMKELIRNKAEKRLNQGLQTNNSDEIKVSLGVFENLGLKSDIISQITNNNLKNIVILWKNLLTKEYEQSTILLAFANEAKNVVNECFLSSLLIYRLYKINENLQTFMLFWNKIQHIINQSILKLKENSDKYTQNWQTLIRSYPKLFFLFEEWVLNFKENTFFTDFKELTNPLASLQELSEIYKEGFNKELLNRFNKSINFLEDKKSDIEFWTDIQKLVSFVGFELKETSCSKILRNTLLIFLFENWKNLIKKMQDKTKGNIEEIQINTFVQIISMTTFFQNELNSQIFSVENFQNFEFIDFYDNFNNNTVNRFFEKILLEILRIFSFGFENYCKNKWNSNNFWDQIILTLAGNNPRLAAILEGNFKFNELYSEFINIFLNIYIVFIGIIGINDKDQEILSGFIEKIRINNSFFMQKVFQIGKIWVLDSKSIDSISDNMINNDFFAKNLLAYICIKRVKKNGGESNRNFLEYFSKYFDINDLKMEKIKETFNSESSKKLLIGIIDNFKKNGNNDFIELAENLLK